MTPKEKAKELLWKYLPILEGWKKEDSSQAKQCALKAVDEIIEIFEFMVASNLQNHQFMAILNYWDEVRKEIENFKQQGK